MEERRCCKIGWGLENVTRKKANFFGQQKKGKCDVQRLELHLRRGIKC